MIEGFQHLLFYIFALVLLFASTMVITVKNPVRAAMFLVLAFFSSAAIWMLLSAEFLALTLILVYVGAVMVLFLFVVMMLDINLAPISEGFSSHISLSIFVGVIIVSEMFLVLVGGGYFSAENFPLPAPFAADYNNTLELGKLLYTHYVYSFELAAAVLILAIVAAIALVHRKSTNPRKQNPAEQVKVQARDRLRVLSMDPEE
jgi:NADH-quinone oxidoreductase subunit J